MFYKATMDGGYINEGGQLKTKNGQKYVINNRPSGIFVSKACAILSGIIAVLALIIVILVTYFVAISNKISCDIQSQTNKSVIAAGTLFGLSKSESTDISDNFVGKKLNLYEGWNPIIYRLIIEPNITTSASNGSVSIDIEKDKSVKGVQPIVLDVNNISISRVSVRYTNSIKNSYLNISTKYGDYNETFQITIISKLDDSDNILLTLELDFVSQLTNTLQGLYKTSYENVFNGKMEWVTSTQFSPTDARRAFPCFDRPDKKANFSISIIREEIKTMTLSNMPSKLTSFHRPGYVQEDFETTPKMSTYLVAFIISDLVKANNSFDDKQFSPRIEIWTRPETINMTNYAYTVTRKLLPYFENFFDIPYNLPKIDMVTVPDFGFGAMENWGLITFRDSALLVPEGDKDHSSSADYKEFVACIIAHELAHQWFGNLVTPKWWDDLWLKEGFATYMSYLAINQIEPEWKLLDTLTVNEFQLSMEADSDQSSHPISFPVSDTVDIRRIFDPISYSKGAIIIRMMNSFLGDQAFKSAIRSYLKKFSYSNAIQDDLWKLMTEFGHNYQVLPKDLNVKSIMDSWTIQGGYPVVTVERSGNYVILSQQRYMLPSKNTKDKTKWYIPITYKTDEDNDDTENRVHWMSNEHEKLKLSSVFSNPNNSENLIYFNLNRQGYYRVNYDYSSWVVLNKKFSSLPLTTRAQLLDDSFQLARAEYLTYDVPLTFLLKMQAEVDNILLWASASQSLRYLTQMLNREPAFESFRSLMKFIVRPAFDHYGLDEPIGESHTQLMHRARVAKLACYFNYDRCTSAAQMKYRKWMADKNNLIKPNLKETIYCTALREGSFHEWYFVYNKYKEITVASEKEQILSALGCTTKPWLLSKYLNMTIDPNSGIRKQDGARAFISVAKNAIGYEIAHDFLVTNIKEISEYFGDGFSTLSKMVYAVTTFMNKDYQLEQFDKFSNKTLKLGLKSIERSINLAKDKVRNNIAWRSRSYYSLKGYLEDMVNEFHINLLN